MRRRDDLEKPAIPVDCRSVVYRVDDRGIGERMVVRASSWALGVNHYQTCTKLPTSKKAATRRAGRTPDQLDERLALDDAQDKLQRFTNAGSLVAAAVELFDEGNAKNADQVLAAARGLREVLETW